MPFSLAKIAYQKCSPEDRSWYHAIPGHKLTVDIQDCCNHLISRSYQMENCQSLLPDVCTSAAMYGHLDCLRQAHLRGLARDRHTTDAAVYDGNVEYLRYVHENGCEAEGLKVALMSAITSEMAALEYSLLNDFNLPIDFYTVIDRRHNVGVLELQRRHGC